MFNKTNRKDMKFKNAPQETMTELPDGFFYVGQDNYHIELLDDNSINSKNYLYSDSATSCIIIIVEGVNKDGHSIVALSHLSRPERFAAFFDVVADNFCGSVKVFAQGANPPEPSFSNGEIDYTSLRNEQLVIDWISANIDMPSTPDKATRKWFISQSTLSVGMGNPQEDDRGCYGIDLTTMVVSNQRYELSILDRDPTGGVQTLFCVFGLKVDPKIVLHKATDSFTTDEIKRLVDQANEENWTDILTMTPDEILDNYSSTPEYEAPWFAETLLGSALYVSIYNHENKKVCVL